MNQCANLPKVKRKKHSRMSTEEERTVVSDVENAKKSDETSTAGEHQLSDVANKIPTEEVDAKEGETVDSNVTNEKMKVIESSTDETNHDKPNEELTVV